MYLDKEVPSVVTFDIIAPSFPIDLPLRGYASTNSQWDIQNGFSAVLSAYVVGAMEYLARSRLGQQGWRRYFPSRALYEVWLHQSINVAVLTPHAAQLKVLQLAVEFMERVAAIAPPACVKVHPCTADASQGSEFTASTLSVSESTKEWTRFASDIKRAITMASRNYRTIGLPSLRRTGYSSGLKSNRVSAIQAFEELAASACTHITWGHIQRHLDCLWPADTAWHHWAQYAEPLVRASMGPGTPPRAESSPEHTHLSHCQSGSQDQRKNPFELRQCPPTLLRYLGGLLALTGYPSSDLTQWLHDGLFVIRRFGAQKSRILAAQYTRDSRPRLVSRYLDPSSCGGITCLSFHHWRPWPRRIPF